ncbi:MAG: MAPEG family protein [Pseudomonadota bacterium]
MEFPVFTAVFAAVLIILQQILMLSVGLHRAATLRGVGVGDDATLLRKQRRHGNLSENSAILIILIGLLELTGASASAVLAFAALFLGGRVFHAIGFSFDAGASGTSLFAPPAIMRALGAFATGLGGIAAAGYVLWLNWPSFAAVF